MILQKTHSAPPSQTAPTDLESARPAPERLRRPAGADPQARLIGAAIVLIGLALLLRGWLAAALAISDPTEARYADVAREMAFGPSGWLVPRMADQSAFLAKPPLATWAAAVGLRLFGLTELSVRSGSLAAAALMLAVVGWLEPHANRLGRMVALLALVATPAWFALSATVATDAWHALAVSAALACAWRVLGGERSSKVGWLVGFWAALGVGLLAKGPVTALLAVLPIALFAIATGSVRASFTRLWRLWGMALAVGIAAPWYLLVERERPGFLDYFVLGEHLRRFVEPGWAGDRYGSAHLRPMGRIWLDALMGLFPWALGALLCGAAYGWRTGTPMRRSRSQTERRMLWLAAGVVAPLVFFTFARNILWTYCLTAAAPLALLVGQAAQRNPGKRLAGAVIAISALMLVVAAAALGTFGASLANQRSERALIGRYRELVRTHPAPLVYTYRPPASASFYAGGAVQAVDDLAQARTRYTDTGSYVVVPNEPARAGSLPGQDVQVVGRFHRNTLLWLKGLPF